jgi:hypothetical protein
MCFYDAPPNSLMGSIVNLKVTPMEGEWARASSLARNTSRVEGQVGTLGWGLGRLISKSITHTHLHKPNHKLVSAWLEPFWCTDEPWAITDSQDSPRPGLRGNHHLLPYSILYAWPGANTQMSFYLGIPKIGTFVTLAAHNFVCIPPIEMRFNAKL